MALLTAAGAATSTTTGGCRSRTPLLPKWICEAGGGFDACGTRNVFASVLVCGRCVMTLLVHTRTPYS